MLKPRNNRSVALFDVIEAAVRIGGPTVDNPLQSNLPLAFGPIGVALGPLASVALSTAGTVASHDPKLGSTSVDELLTEGTIQRAILAEAAFGVFVEIDEDYLQESGFFQNMKDTVLSLTPFAKELAPHLISSLLEPALRISMENLRKKDFTSTYTAEDFMKMDSQMIAVLHDNEAKAFSKESSMNPMIEDFIRALLQPTFVPRYPHRDFPNSIESSQLEDVVKAGLQRSRPLLSNTAQGQVRLEMAIHDIDIRTYEHSTSIMTAFSGVFQRAIVAEAALQAMMKLSPTDFEEQHGMPDGSTESWCNAMRKTIEQLSPQIMMSAPAVVKAVKPIVKILLKRVPDISQSKISPPRPYTPRSISSSTRPAPSSSVCSPSRPTLRKKKSIRSISAGGIVPLDGEPAPPLPTYGLSNGL
ncbi:hypothetical protein MMC14_001581 [Varicellaria rhodocarpa]|nr:hypothetical protein [Varicellaria rhodocarpa]